MNDIILPWIQIPKFIGQMDLSILIQIAPVGYGHGLYDSTRQSTAFYKCHDSRHNYHSEWNVHDKKQLFAFVIGMEAFLQAIFVHSDRGVARE
jgi:hypothetical protein